MREVLSVCAAFAVLAGITTLAAGSLHDRELFVPPPDAVAEQFTRAVMSGRWDPAREYLRDPESMTTEELEAMRRELGQRQNVEAETQFRDETRAVVVVRIPSRDVVRNFGLTFEGGWKID